jgi:hypothetical protein
MTPEKSKVLKKRLSYARKQASQWRREVKALRLALAAQAPVLAPQEAT